MYFARFTIMGSESPFNKEQCNSYLNINRTSTLKFTPGYEGVPENLLLNFVGWLVSVLLFSTLLITCRWPLKTPSSSDFFKCTTVYFLEWFFLNIYKLIRCEFDSVFLRYLTRQTKYFAIVSIEIRNCIRLFLGDYRVH